MNKKNTLSMGPIKIFGLGTLIVFIAVLAMFIFLQDRSSKKEREDKIIINIFGKQRMYTQMMAKDASSLYALLKDLEDFRANYPFMDVQNSLVDFRVNLKNARSEFAETLNVIESGYLQLESERINISHLNINDSPYLTDLKSLWADFDLAVQTMIQAIKIDDKVYEADKFINQNNIKLLELCEQIQELILNDSIKTDGQISRIIYTLIALLSILMVIALINLMKYIILPFKLLYNGISDIGLNNYTINHELPTNKKVIPMLEDINQMFLKINNLITLIEDLNSNNTSFQDSLAYINSTFSQFIPYNYIGIALLDDEKKYLKASYGVSDGTVRGLPEKMIGHTWLLSETGLEKLIWSGDFRIIKDLEKYTESKPMKEYNRIILDVGIRSSITMPLLVSNEPVGVIFFSSTQKDVYREEHQNFLKTLVNSIAISFSKSIFINDLVFSGILALAKLAEARDEDTGEHLDRMKEYSRLIAELLYEESCYQEEITPEFIDRIERFSPLHDIGKVAIRDEILLKPGKLTESEYEEMKQHTLYGARVLRSAEDNISKKGRSMFELGIEIAEYHHEKWDGTGYPYGIKGNEIPISARIVAVADVFDALTSNRPYKKAFSMDIAIDIIKESKGKHFDPLIVDVFMKNRQSVEQLYMKFLNHGELSSKATVKQTDYN